MSRTFRLLGASATVACLLGAPGIASAQSFSFTPPAGVMSYRLAFVTSDTIAATSTDISTYNGFVTSEAALDTSLPSTTWTAIASTSSISAASNISCGATCDANDPIYLIDGTTEVATSAAALFAGTILNAIAEDENANSVAPGYVWTGSNADGSAATGDELGSSNPSFGDTGYTPYLLTIQPPLPYFYDSSATLPIFAISGEIDVPEPMSLSLLAMGGLATGMVRRLRRKRPVTA